MTHETQHSLKHQKAIQNDYLVKLPEILISLIFFYSILFDVELSEYPGVNAFTSELYNKGVRAPYLLSFMVDLNENQLERGCEDHKNILKSTLEVCKLLEAHFLFGGNNAISSKRLFFIWLLLVDNMSLI